MEVVDTDVLIIGGGGAAARAAIEANSLGADVIMIVKGRMGKCGSTATGKSEAMGIAAAIGHAKPQDNPHIHFRDTIKAGAGLCDEKLVWILAKEAPKQLYYLVKFGIQFDMAEDKLLQRMSDMATYPRVCVKDGVTGRAILEGLMKAIKQTDIQVFENVMATRLLTNEGAVVGAVGIRLETGDPLLFKAKSTILATGGAGCVFLFNAFTPEMTGDGYAMAYDVGAKLINMEFIQMGPAIVHPIIRVISGPLWRFNPELYNVLGEKFLERYLPSNVTSSEVFKLKAFPFSTRNSAMFLDIAIYSEIKFGRGTEHGGIFFDVTHASEEEFEQIAPITFKDMLSYGIDLRKQPVEIGIVAQNFGGGVKINEKTETGIPGLYAAGEVAGGLRGPDRPGGNALAECQVFGARAGRYATKRAKKVGDPVLDLIQVEREVKRINNILNGEVEPRVIRKRIQRIMWEEAFIIRNGAGLKRALNELRKLRKNGYHTSIPQKGELFEALSLRNLVIVGKAIVLAALTREESRGSHYREDFPKKDEKWLKYISIYRANKGMKQRIVKPKNLLPRYACKTR